MSYVIERGIPLPTPVSSHRRIGVRGPRTVLSRTLDAMQVGDSFVVQTRDEVDALRQRTHAFYPKRFVVRSIGDGGRVWRIE